MYYIYIYIYIYIYMTLKQTDKQYKSTSYVYYFLFLTEGQINYVLSLCVGFSWYLLLVLFSFFPILTLSWRRLFPYKNQSIDLHSKSMDWSLYDYSRRHERARSMKHFLISISVSKVNYRARVETTIFIATKTPRLWLSYLTQSSDGKALEKSCKWLLFLAAAL